MNNFAAVAEHFRKLRCAFCQQAFTPEGLKLLREEKDYWVVRVHCTACDQPSGVAIVGVDFDGSEPTAAPRGERAQKAEKTERVRGIFSSRKEEEKFGKLGPITSDELLDAVRAIKDLGADWMRQLPRQ
jgi:hypothetical protein